MSSCNSQWLILGVLLQLIPVNSLKAVIHGKHKMIK
jgi:hypothetical protein